MENISRFIHVVPINTSFSCGFIIFYSVDVTLSVYLLRMDWQVVPNFRVL